MLSLDANTSNNVTGATSSTHAHTCGSSGRDLCLFVMVMLRGSPTMPTGISASYNGVSMTSIGSVSGATDNLVVAAFHLTGPSTGSNNVVVNWTNNSNGYIVARSYYGVSRGSPSSNYTTQAETTSNPSLSVTCMGNNIAMDVIAYTDNGTYTLTIGAGQTSIINLSTASAMIAASSFEQATASGAVSMTWTKSTATRHVGLGFEIVAALGAGTPVVSPFMRL